MKDVGNRCRGILARAANVRGVNPGEEKRQEARPFHPDELDPQLPNTYNLRDTHTPFLGVTK